MNNEPSQIVKTCEGYFLRRFIRLPFLAMTVLALIAAVTPQHEAGKGE